MPINYKSLQEKDNFYLCPELIAILNNKEEFGKFNPIKVDIY